MTQRILFLSVLALYSVATGCSSRSERTVASVQSDTQITASTSNPSAADGTGIPAPVTKPAGDNSDVVTSRDEMGNVIETRTFSNNAYVDKIVVKTYVDGSKIGSIIGKDGEKLPLTDAQIAIAHQVNGDEFAEIVGLRKPLQTVTESVTVPATAELPSFKAPAAVPVQADSPSNPPQNERAVESSSDLAVRRAAAMQNELRRMQLPRQKN